MESVIKRDQRFLKQTKIQLEIVGAIDEDY